LDSQQVNRDVNEGDLQAIRQWGLSELKTPSQDASIDDANSEFQGYIAGIASDQAILALSKRTHQELQCPRIIMMLFID
jgi:hypothetical protein